MRKLFLSIVMSLMALIVFAEPQKHEANVKAITFQLIANGAGMDVEDAKCAACINAQDGMWHEIEPYVLILNEMYFKLIGKKVPWDLPIIIVPEFTIEKEEFSYDDEVGHICTISAKTETDLKQILRPYMQSICSSYNVPFNEAKFTRAYNYAVKKVNNIH